MILLVAHALAACPEPALALVAALEEAELAWRALDTAALRAADDRARGMAGCLAEPVRPSVAARMHRIEGLRAYADKDMVRAAQAFAAARRVEPGSDIVSDIVPEGHPLRALAGGSSADSGALAPMDSPATGHLEVDGRASESRPLASPALILLVDRGQVLASAYTWPTEAVFPYPVRSAEPPPIAAAPSSTSAPSPSLAPPAERPAAVASAGDRTAKRKRGPNGALLGTAFASAAVAGGCYAVSIANWNVYYDDDTDISDLPYVRADVNGFQDAALGFSALALGTGIAAFVAGTW
jgi:hypothetical protein